MNIDAFHYMDLIRKLLLHLPGVEEYICFGTPAFRVKKRLLARLKEDGKTLAVHSDERDVWMAANPSAFYITDHYQNYAMVLVRLNVIKQKYLQQLLFDAWTQIAPKRLLKEYNTQT